MQETWVQSLGGEGPLEKGMATHSSILAGESHGQESGPRGPVHRVEKSWIRQKCYILMNFFLSIFSEVSSTSKIDKNFLNTHSPFGWGCMDSVMSDSL